jgi:hypothetical protein
MAPTKNKEPQQTSFLTPRVDPTKIEGKLLYSERDQSWNIIRFKKELLKEFPQLNEKRMTFGYKMVISKTKEEIKKVMSEFEENGAIPILLVFNREEKN